MRPVDVARLSEERRGLDWSSQPSQRTLDDIDESAIKLVRSLLRDSGEESKIRIGRLSDREILDALRLLREDGSLTRAGDYLLCTPDNSAHDILVYQHRQTRAGEADDVRRWKQPILTAFVEAVESISVRVGSRPVNTSRGQQIRIEDYPVAGVREALANALIHGDIRERRAVQIEHSPEALEVRSPGPLVSGITPENILTHGSRPRFPLLASVMRNLGLAEELGQGADRMFREMVRNGRNVPTVRVDDGDSIETTVRFVGGPPNLQLAKFVAELPEPERSDTDALLVTLLLCERRSVTARDVAPIIQRDVSEAESVLRRLAHGDAEMLEPTQGTVNRVHPNYRLRSSALATLGSAVRYNRRPQSETQRKVFDHIREYGTISNSTIQRMFDLDVYAARDVLQDLVGREFLVRISKQTRGVAVKYGPGPNFPDKPKRRRPSAGDSP